MDNIPDNIVDKSLYIKAKKEADKKYKRHSLYKSSFIQKRYQELGGKYKGKKPSKEQGIQRWLDKEQWVEVIPYLDGKIIQCGTSDRKGKACRPLKKANDKTPITLPQLIKKHGKDKIRELASKKVKNMNLRINWDDGKIY